MEGRRRQTPILFQKGMKKWIAESADEPTKRFVIEEEEGIGFYLYVYEGEKCTNDYLQDSFEIVVEQAEEEFGITLNAWKLKC